MVKEKIPIASDHGGFELKKELAGYLHKLGFEPVDLGAYSAERVDYPKYAKAVAEKISKNKYKRGIVICKTGIGVSIVANKFPRVRAALATNEEMAELSRKHNNSNILALGAGFLTAKEAKKIVKKWLLTKPEMGRHQKRRKQIRNIEKMLA
ncbi:ribose 5-phosphate isomerase B [Candidatus Woesearchaeota archaeon]|nr:ribose 5-phosphate isomerase B [Candidatus Woesearchaeota archaeon]